MNPRYSCHHRCDKHGNEIFPGYGLAIDFENRGCTENYHQAFTDVFEWQARPLGPKEIAMVTIMNQVMEKLDWEIKVFDQEVASKWKDEMLSLPNFSDKMADYCIGELRDKADSFQKTAIAAPIDYESQVVYTDGSALNKELIAAVASLEDMPEHIKDWHPRSDGQIVDLVDPSLYPLMYGSTRVLSEGTVGLDDCVSSFGQGQIIPVPEAKPSLSDYWSTRFQWLPCEVQLRDEDDVKITSYINNLHPVLHKNLYRVIEKVISKSIPLWDQVLTKIGTLPDRDAVDTHQSRVWVESSDNYEGQEPPTAEPGSYGTLDRISDKQDPVDLRKQYHESGLQMIVKLANIELTPDKPSYEGSWHAEGLLNEHIVASSLYYYSQSNIGSSHLAFRQNLETGSASFGDYTNGIQELGQVLTKEGRLFVFPNVLQYRVPQFELRDSSKPGYCKILMLFLVDPHVRILSTAKVPPQQQSWWTNEVIGEKADIKGFDRLPQETIDQILEEVDFPISLKKAKRIREESMQERSRGYEKLIEVALDTFS